MKEWLKMLFHHHKWMTLNSADIVDEGGDKIGRRYIQQCNICGKLHKVDIR